MRASEMMFVFKCYYLQQKLETLKTQIKHHLGEVKISSSNTPFTNAENQ